MLWACHVIAFIMLRYVPSIPAFWRVFIINGCWLLSKVFSVSIKIIIWFLFFNLLIWCIILIDLHILKNPCIPGINPTWSWYIILLMCCWILFASILFRFFVYLHQWYWHVTVSFVTFLVLLSVWYWPCRLNLGVCLPLQFFGRVWEGCVLALL